MNVFTPGAVLVGDSKREKEAATEAEGKNEDELGGRKRGIEGSGGGESGRVVGTSGSRGVSILPRMILMLVPPGQLVASTGHWPSEPSPAAPLSILRFDCACGKGARSSLNESEKLPLRLWECED